MKSATLNMHEFEELERRGFFAKKNFEFKDLLKSVLNIILYLSLFLIASTFVLGVILLIFFPPGAENISIWSYIGIGITLIYIFLLGILPLLNFIFSFFKSGISLYSNNSILEFGKMNGNKSRSLFFIDKLINNFLFQSKDGWIGGLIILFLISSITIYLLGIFDYFTFDDFLFNRFLIEKMSLFIFINEIFAALLVGLLILILAATLLLGRRIYQSLNPLYAFGNLGEKIQTLTPNIESQSQLIQNEFKKDMNFVVLHSGFKKLSSTFNTIIALVLKLEKIETRANKGNLFDSEKYINSLRSDITEPLISLKEFLMKQRQEMIESQRELTRVRVGGSEELGNIELTSKRSESLISELDMNIGTLETMIEKMNQ